MDSYSYDDNGNMTSGNGRSVTWTSFNKDRQGATLNGRRIPAGGYDHRVFLCLGLALPSGVLIRDGPAGAFRCERGRTGTLQRAGQRCAAGHEQNSSLAVARLFEPQRQWPCRHGLGADEFSSIGRCPKIMDRLGKPLNVEEADSAA